MDIENTGVFKKRHTTRGYSRSVQDQTKLWARYYNLMVDYQRLTELWDRDQDIIFELNRMLNQQKLINKELRKELGKE